jgi:5-methyltetrahydrofolate--homocysteine methyltransferase
MEIVGKRFENETYYLPDLVYSGEIMRRMTEVLMPEIKKSPSKGNSLGKFLIGTVEGDIHDIGKDIVVFMMDVNGFEVFDLGVDVPADEFVAKIKEVKPQVVGLSGILTISFDSMKETVDAIKAAGLRDKVKIVVGGPQVDEEVREYSGADAFRKDAVSGVALAKEWTGGE